MENTYTDHENNIQRVSDSTGAKFSCVHMYVPLQIPDIRYIRLWMIMIRCIVLIWILRRTDQ